jgi:hypothetical protein
MICNIIDRGKHRYRWKRIKAIVEATWHDNLKPDSEKNFGPVANWRWARPLAIWFHWRAGRWLRPNSRKLSALRAEGKVFPISFDLREHVIGGASILKSDLVVSRL